MNSQRNQHMITEPTSISEEVDMTNPYAVFHGQGEFDAMAVFRFETTSPMDFDATASSLVGQSAIYRMTMSCYSKTVL